MRRSVPNVAPLLILMAIVLVLLIPVRAAAQATPKAPQPTVRWLFPPPELRIGEFRAALRLRLHLDWHDFDPELGEDEFEVRRARVVLEGRVYDDLEYEFDADLAEDPGREWKDVFANYRRYRFAEVKGGRFKIPFGLDQNTSVTNLNFVERSLIGAQLAPSRATGGMVHGRFASDAVAYQVGLFRGDGDNTDYVVDDADDVALEPIEGEFVDHTWAGRVVLAPWQNSRNILKSSEFGAAFTSGTLEEGLFGLRGETLSGFNFTEQYYVKGSRQRFGLEGRWMPGPFSVQAEYIRVSDERNSQGLGDVDLPDAIAQGWYVAGTWTVTGENKGSGYVDPSRPFPTKGPGAVELAVRFEELRFTSAGDSSEPPFDNPRAENILPNSDQVVTFGVNWYMNPFARVMVNGTRETLEDPSRTPIEGRTRYWGVVLRLQLQM
jgi:phosphate-selective porin OprO/OprP